ncbi:TIGR04255 family protein [Asanoa sp. NPDC050611]|uniref:TIGR04255 family protein n=1 Tax=Asanoa sp. NPDC050611 TaxID=3157098 RepID=UPI0033DCA4FC
MTGRPRNLPDYERPPIDEVAIAVQFPSIEGCTTDRLRDFWKEVRQDYPFVEHQVPIEVELEKLTPQPVKTVQFQLVTAPPQKVRLWLINESDDFLVQVQDSRFIQNWRRRGSDYPHFEQVRDLFWSNFKRFQEFLEKSGLPRPSVQQTEVTYINWVDKQLAIEEFLRPASHATIVVAGSTHATEAQAWNARYLIPVPDTEVVQRLHVQAAPAIRTSNAQTIGTQLSLVVRAADEKGMEEASIANRIDGARRIIVEAFTSLTTSSAHEVWKRSRES